MASPDKIDNQRGHCNCFSEAELGVRDRDLRADELIQLGATGLRRCAGIGDTLVIAERAGGVSAQQLRVADEHREAISVAAEASEHHSPERQRERPEEEVTS